MPAEERLSGKRVLVLGGETALGRALAVGLAQSPPAPAFWHHQLGDEPQAPKLDGAAFAEQLRSLLAEQSTDAG